LRDPVESSAKGGLVDLEPDQEDEEAEAQVADAVQQCHHLCRQHRRDEIRSDSLQQRRADQDAEEQLSDDWGLPETLGEVAQQTAEHDQCRDSENYQSELVVGTHAAKQSSRGVPHQLRLRFFCSLPLMTYRANSLHCCHRRHIVYVTPTKRRGRSTP